MNDSPKHLREKHGIGRRIVEPGAVGLSVLLSIYFMLWVIWSGVHAVYNLFI